MSKLLLIIACLGCFNILIATSTAETHGTHHAPKSIHTSMPKDTTIATGITPVDENGCYSGGYGAPSCNISPGIVFADGISGGCSVTCKEGYYACCAVRCTCKKQE